jgi:hypothetical protein
MGAAELVFDEFLTARGIMAWRDPAARKSGDLTATSW